jgi:hypothetical protein
MKTVIRALTTALKAVVTLLLSTSAIDAGTLHFNGLGTYVWVGPRPELKITGSSLTLEAWIKPTGRGSDAIAGGMIMGREGEYLLARFADGTIRYAFAATSPAWAWNSTGIVVPTNQWSHVALTYDGMSITLYVNGTLRALAGGSGVIGDADAARNDFVIGTRQLAAQYFQGQMDEVRVWSVARSQAEIQADMNRPLAGSEAGLLGYYRFEEGFGFTTGDSTGRGLTGLIPESPIWDAASDALDVPVPITEPAVLTGPITAGLKARVNPNGIATSNAFWLATSSSTALEFDGVNDSVSFQIGPNYAYNAYPLTATAWVKTSGQGGGGGIVNKYVSGSANGWQIYLLNGQVRAWYFRDNANKIAGDGNGLNGGNVDDGQWHHVAFTVGAAGGELYVDGRLMATNAWTGAAGACTTTQVLRFGMYDPSFSVFAGQIDDVTIWNTELTPVAIAQLMTTPPTPAHPQYANLLGYWPLDEGTGNSTSEAWGHSVAGLLAADPHWVPQARPLHYSSTSSSALTGTNQVLDLDGVDDYVRVPAGVWFSNEFTIECWVFERSYNNYSRIIDFGNGAPSDNVLLALSAGTTGRPYFQTFPSTQAVQPPDPIPLNQWMHLAATLKSNVGTIYYNGVAVVSGPVTAPSGTVVRNFNFIGHSLWATDGFPNALFDDVRIWKVARTPAQIRQFMTEPVLPSDTNLVLNYRFDEPSGVTAVDSRATAPQNGTLTNGASRLPFESTSVVVSSLASATRYDFRSVATCTNGTEVGLASGFATPTPAAGTALALDGNNDYARVRNFGNVAPTTEVTIEFWQRTHAVKNQSTFSLDPDNTANRFHAHVPWSDGRVYWDFGNISGSGRISYVPPEPIVGTWQHFALVSSVTSNYMRIYRNGILETNKAGAGTFTRTAADLILGRSPSYQYDGELDEFRIWNVARDATSILRDFNRRLVGDETNLVAYYRFDEGAGGLLADATGHGYDGLFLGTNSPTWEPSSAAVGWPIVKTTTVMDTVLGDVTVDATFKGDSSTDTRVWIEYGRYVPVPNSAESRFYGYYSPSVPQPISSLSQVNFEAVPAYAGTFTNINFYQISGHPPEWPGGYPQFYAARYVGRLFVPNPGTYTFYVASDDGSVFLLDGQTVLNYDGLHGAGEVGTTTSLTAGYHWLEARMFNNYGDSALMISYSGPGIAKQIIPAEAFQKQEAQFTSRTTPRTFTPAIGFQAFTGMATNVGASGTWVFRVAAANAYGTNYGPFQTVLMGQAGAFSALFLNGLGAHVEVPDGDYFLAFPYRDPFTLEAWINPTWIGATQTVIGKFNQPSQREYFLALNPSGKVVFHRQGSDYVSSASVPAGQFTHIAATYDGSQRRIYINGELDPAVDPGSGIITNWTAPFVIGACYWSNSLTNFFPGTIDDVRVWAVARSQLQIATDRNRRLSGYELGLAAYYRFDEAQGSSAADSTVYDNIAWLMNGAVFVPSGVSFACSTATPVLSIEPLSFGPGVVLWWPITCNEYILEEASLPNAPPEAWHPVYEPVTPVEGDYAVVLLRDRWDSSYFRLRRL